MAHPLALEEDLDLPVWRTVPPSGRPSASSPPSHSTVSSRSARPVMIEATAALAAPVPDARVYDGYDPAAAPTDVRISGVGRQRWEVRTDQDSAPRPDCGGHEPRRS